MSTNTFYKIFFNFSALSFQTLNRQTCALKSVLDHSCIINADLFDNANNLFIQIVLVASILNKS